MNSIGWIMVAASILVGGYIGYWLNKDESKHIKREKNIVDSSIEIFKAFELWQEKQEYEEAYKILLKYAKRKEPLAQYYLAEMYLEEDFLRKGDTKAFGWMKKAADQDNKDAVSAVIKMYQEGIGTKKNEEIAMFYSKKLKGLK